MTHVCIYISQFLIMVKKINPQAPGASSAFFIPSFINHLLFQLPVAAMGDEVVDDGHYFLVIDGDKNDCVASPQW